MNSRIVVIALSLVAVIAAAVVVFSVREPLPNQSATAIPSNYFDQSAAIEDRIFALEAAVAEARNARLLLEDELQALYDELRDETEVQIITLSVFEKPEVSQDWVNNQGFDVPLFKNPITDRGAVAVADGSYFFIKGTPMVFLIDKNGILRNESIGTAASITAAHIRSLL